MHQSLTENKKTELLRLIVAVGPVPPDPKHFIIKMVILIIYAYYIRNIRRWWTLPRGTQVLVNPDRLAFKLITMGTSSVPVFALLYVQGYICYSFVQAMCSFLAT